MGQNFVVNVWTGIMMRKVMIVMIKIMIFLMRKITGKKCIICSDYEIDIRSCVRHQVSLFCMPCGPCWAVLDQSILFVNIAMNMSPPSVTDQMVLILITIESTYLYV